METEDMDSTFTLQLTLSKKEWENILTSMDFLSGQHPYRPLAGEVYDLRKKLRNIIGSNI